MSIDKTANVFCVAPWTHLHSFPNGDVIACCLSPAEEVLGNLNNSTLKEIWNSDKMKELRRNIMAGVPTENICHRCYDKERQGFQSLRIGLNASYAKTEPTSSVIDSTLGDGTVNEFNLIHWDFRFSNLCNLSCRSCGPGLSSSWASDHKEIFKDYTEPAIIKLPDDKNRSFLSNILENIDKVKSIHFAGGEPMMMEEHWIILDELEKAGRQDVKLHYSTNFTNFKYKGRHAFEYWEKFESVYVSASIDDIEDRFEYTRNGGKWANVLKNLNDFKTKQFRNAELAFHPTISVFNVYHLPELVKFIFENNNFQNPIPDNHMMNYFIHVVNLNPLTYPDFYSIQMLPTDDKIVIEKRLRELIKYSAENITYHVEPIISLINFMHEKNTQHLLPNFTNFTQKLDKIRGQNFFKTFPELSHLYYYLDK